MHEEIKLRISATNKNYYAIKAMFSSKLLCHRTKEKLYNTYLCPIVILACETWTSTKAEGKQAIFKLKILRRI